LLAGRQVGRCQRKKHAPSPDPILHGQRAGLGGIGRFGDCGEGRLGTITTMDLVDFLARLEILAFSPFGLVDRHRTLVEAR